jgi:N-acylneuraminate cytidylyltransferase
MNTLFLIPARGGSKGIPHKNIKLLAGKPLIKYSIDIARQLTDDENICVSTDDIKIKDVVNSMGLSVPFLRPDYLASDTASTNDVILHALNFYKEQGVVYDIIVLLQPTSPFRRVEDVKACLALFNSNLDMVTTVKKSFVSAVLCNEDENGNLQMTFGANAVRRQEANELYEYNGAVYVINANAITQKGLAGFTKRVKYVMPEINSIDIDTITDWYIAESLIEKKVIEL